MGSRFAAEELELSGVMGRCASAHGTVEGCGLRTLTHRASLLGVSEFLKEPNRPEMSRIHGLELKLREFGL